MPSWTPRPSPPAWPPTPRPRRPSSTIPATPRAAEPRRKPCAPSPRPAGSADILLISDEVYRDLHFGVRPPSLRDVSPCGVVLGSMSKGWAAPGLRVGWAVGDPRWLAPARTVHAFAVTAASAPCQRAALALLEASGTVLPQGRREIAARAGRRSLPHGRTASASRSPLRPGPSTTGCPCPRASPRWISACGSATRPRSCWCRAPPSVREGRTTPASVSRQDPSRSGKASAGWPASIQECDPNASRGPVPCLIPRRTRWRSARRPWISKW